MKLLLSVIAFSWRQVSASIDIVCGMWYCLVYIPSIYCCCCCCISYSYYIVLFIFIWIFVCLMQYFVVFSGVFFFFLFYKTPLCLAAIESSIHCFVTNKLLLEFDMFSLTLPLMHRPKRVKGVIFTFYFCFAMRWNSFEFYERFEKFSMPSS